MKKKKIIDEKGNVVAEVLGIAETNPHYDERLSANGGGYSQPTTVMRWEDWDVSIEDTSCGDFGTRIFAVAKQSSGRKLSAYWGSMIADDLCYSEFTAADVRMLDDVYALTGYNIPTKEQFEDEGEL